MGRLEVLGYDGRGRTGQVVGVLVMESGFLNRELDLAKVSTVKVEVSSLSVR